MKQVATITDAREILSLPEEARQGTMTDQAGFHMDQHNSASLMSHTIKTTTLAKAQLHESLAEGMFGKCKDCENEISPARLKAVPNAVRCRTCQEIFEAMRAPSRR